MKNNYKKQLLTNFVIILSFVFITKNSLAQTIIAQQDFEASPATPTLTYTNSGGTIGTRTPGTPTGATTVYAGTRGYYENSGTSIFTSNTNIDTRCYLSPSLTFKLAALSTGTTRGVDATDNVTIAISTNGGTSYTNEMRIQGATANNAYWSYTSGTATASAVYDGNGTLEAAKTFAPAAGGSRTTDGYSTVTLNGIPNTATLRIKITLVNNRASETWAIDNIVLSSTNTKYSNPVSVPVASGSRCGTGTVSMLATGAGAGESYNWYTVSSGGTVSLSNSSTFTTPSIASTTNYFVTTCNSTVPTCESSAARVTAIATINTLTTAPTSNSVSSNPICEGNSTTLTQNGGALGNSSSWKWYSDAGYTTLIGTSVAANASFTVSPTSTTTYYLRAEGQNATCTVASIGSATVTVQPVPTANSSSITAYVGDYITVPAGIVTNGTYSWTHNGTGYFDQTYFPVGNEFTANPTYYVETGDFGNTVNLSVTVNGTGACSAVSVSNNYTLNIDGRPGLWNYQCGTTVPFIDEYIYGYDIPGATMYRYRITSDGGTTYQQLDKSNTVIYMRLFPGAKWNSTYTVDVAAQVGGVWSAYGKSCNITTPVLPNTAIISSQRNTTVANFNTSIFTEWIFGVTQYEFSVFDGSNPVQTFRTTNNYFKLSDLPIYTYNTTYQIRVRVLYDGVWQSFGATYNVSTPNSLTKLITTQCGITLTDMNTDIYADNLIGATSYRFRLTDGSTVLTIDKASRTFKPSQVANIKYGTTYVVDVSALLNGTWQSYAATCNLTTPTIGGTQLISSQRNITLTNIATDLYADSYIGATTYRFRVTNGAVIQTIDKASRTFKLNQLPTVFYSATLSIDVDVLVNGVWIGYGTPYNITTPALPNTKIQTSQCGITLSSTTDIIYADAVPGVSQYRFKIVNAGLSYTQTRDKLSSIFRFSELSGLAVNTTYSVEVAVLYNGSWQPYGISCNITTPGVLAMQTVDEGIIAEQLGPNQYSEITEASYETLGFQSIEVESKIEVYPNPSNGNFSLKNIPINSRVSIYDSNGKIIEVLNNQHLSEFSFGENLSKGLFIIEVNSLDNNKRFKLIKE